MSFSDNVKKLRTQKGMSQQSLAKKAGVSQTAVYQWEKGIRSPKIEQLQKIAAALNVPISTFIDDLSEAQRIKSTWEWIQDNDQKRMEIITEILKTHNYRIEEKDIHWLTITDHQGFSFLVDRNEFEEMCLRCDKDIRYNIEKLLNDSRELKK
ncbi:MAG: helix-turn-helix transcriptional regulator [Muricomes sp.]|nr:helix-turn-helix transcriptional regulator [Muricomes sp.]